MMTEVSVLSLIPGHLYRKNGFFVFNVEVVLSRQYFKMRLTFVTLKTNGKSPYKEDKDFIQSNSRYCTSTVE